MTIYQLLGLIIVFASGYILGSANTERHYMLKRRNDIDKALKALKESIEKESKKRKKK